MLLLAQRVQKSMEARGDPAKLGATNLQKLEANANKGLNRIGGFKQALRANMLSPRQ